MDLSTCLSPGSSRDPARGAAYRRVEKPAHHLSPVRRGFRLLLGIVDPRAWWHLLKLVNYYNYAHVQPRREMTIGPKCEISPTATFANARRIKLGARVVIGENTRLWAGPEHAQICIGENTILGPNVLVTAANYRFDAGRPIRDQEMETADIQIGSDVWIGGGATILSGVTIADGAVIGAGVVIARDVPAGCVVVGAKFRITRKRVSVRSESHETAK